MRAVGSFSILVLILVSVAAVANAQGFGVAGQVGYLMGDPGVLLYGVSGEATIMPAVSVRGTLLAGSMTEPGMGLSAGVRLIEAVGLYHLVLPDVRPYAGAGIGQFSVSLFGVSVGFTMVDLVAGLGFPLEGGVQGFVEGHYVLPVGLPAGASSPGGPAVNGGLMYAF